ncbi:MAG: alpha/beta hydrolase [Planctomycetaceae bacterium]|nr:alpha/beta hydrolase [Planctomycetaceae bacterium]
MQHLETTNDTPLILFSGMGSDARLFRLQAPHFSRMIVPDWLPPVPRETLPEYGQRMARQLNLNEPCFVGGASFGGLVALEVARHLPTRGCFLISSIRSRPELPWRYRWLTPFATLVPGLCVTLSQLFARAALGVTDRITKRNPLSPFRVIAEDEGDFHRWAGVATLRWSPPKEGWNFPIFQIHGDRDSVFDTHRSQAETIIPGGGHLLPLTHPQIITRFIQNGMQK